MATRTWSFFRAGGFDQVRLSSGSELVDLGTLDQKLWVALSCPTKGIEFDARTLELMDTDKDGRIRAPELLTACGWAGAMLKHADALSAGSPSLPLAEIREDSEEARRLHSAATAVLAGLGKSKVGELSVADVSTSVQTFNALLFNGDGVVPPDSADDSVTRQVALDVVACTGGAPDKSGKQGFSAANVETFFTAVVAHVTWLAKADSAIMPLGDATAAAFSAWAAVQSKLDDYFARCRLAAFDARLVTALNRDEKDFLAALGKDLTLAGQELKDFPLAQVAAGKPLALGTSLNPAWTAPMAAFVRSVVTPLLGTRTELSEADWLLLLEKLAGHAAWMAEKAGASVEKLGAARLRELAAGPHRSALETLLAKEAEQEPIGASLTAVERLVRYHRDLMKLCNNFVSFQEFYQRKSPAIFQVGTLYLDQRSCELCIKVDDAARHATMAPLAGIYLAYCDCVRPSTGEKMTIAAAFTDGDSDNLMVGRNGIFYDRQGRDWDATITRLVDNPISIRQAFWSPYKKLLRFIEDQVNKRANAADSAVTEKLSATAVGVASAADAPPAPAAAPTPPEKRFDVGTIAALGVAVGGITAALGGMLGAFLGLGMWMPLGIVGLLLAVSLPSMAIAWLKLRRRNLAPLLDANGWAVNAPARVNLPFGRSLTRLAVLPAGSRRELSDPFAEKQRAWRLWAVLLLTGGLTVSWYLGKLDALLPGPAKSVSVMGAYAPAAAPQ